MHFAPYFESCIQCTGQFNGHKIRFALPDIPVLQYERLATTCKAPAPRLGCMHHCTCPMQLCDCLASYCLSRSFCRAASCCSSWARSSLPTALMLYRYVPATKLVKRPASAQLGMSFFG